MERATESPQQRLMTMNVGYWATQALLTAAELGLADALAGGARTAEEIALEINVQGRRLYRLMRALAGLGVLSEEPERRFALTPVGELLRAETPGSMREAVRFTRDHYAAWGELGECVRSGGSGFERVAGAPVFDWLAERPERAQIFDGAMAVFSALTGRAVAGGYDFARYGRIVDVGGGNGALLCAILEAHAGVRGVLADQAAVVERARGPLAAHAVGARIELAPTDFFHAVPEGGDLYTMKSILHDWDDHQARDILANVRRAIGAGPSPLLLIERVLTEHGRPDPGTMGDLNMMIMTTGCERTETEWRALLESAAFRLARVIPLPAMGGFGPSLVEAQPA